jgi:hypothetical protein
MQLRGPAVADQSPGSDMRSRREADVAKVVDPRRELARCEGNGEKPAVHPMRSVA